MCEEQILFLHIAPWESQALGDTGRQHPQAEALTCFQSPRSHSDTVPLFPCQYPGTQTRPAPPSSHPFSEESREIAAVS